MKRIYTLLFLAFVTLLSTESFGQTVVIGTGTETPTYTLYAPFYRFSNSSGTDYCRSNILYTSSELSAVGITTGTIINQISFFKIGAGATTGDASFSIYMANSATTAPLSTSTTWADILTTHSQVYSTTAQSIPATTGWTGFTLTTPFTYTGGSLEIAFDWDISAVSGSPATDKFDWQYTNGFDDYIVGGIGTSSAPTTLNSTTTGYKQRPNIQIQYTPGGPCTSPPNAGSATTSITTVCSSQPAMLNITGNSTGTGQTYVWQSSATAGGSYTNINTSSAIAAYTINPTASMWYRAAVTCSGSTTYSTPVQVIVNPLFPAGSYTINGALPSGGGNYQTFTEVVNAIKCGISGPVTFTVAPGSGPYNESFELPEIGGASATNTITFKGSLSTLAYNSSSSTERAAIILNGADHIIIDSLIIDVSAGSYGWGIALTNQADSNQITNCRIQTDLSSTSTNYAGIVINGSVTGTSSTGNNGNGNMISKNTINGGYYGIYVYGNTSDYNKHNMISGNVIRDFYYSGVYAHGNDSITISKNNMSRPTRSSSTTEYVIYSNSLTNALIEKNRIHNIFGGHPSSTSTCYPIYISGSGESAALPNRVENNLIYNINGVSGTIYGIYAPADNNWNYYHNTIVLDELAATSGTTYGIYVYGTDVNVKNNIVFIARGGTGTKYCLYYATTGVTSSNNNILINNSTAGTTNSIGYQGGGYVTLADWQAANLMANDQLSLNEDPLFANPGAGDYTPESAATNNVGTPVGILTDIVDSVRSSTFPDPGAYEYTVTGRDGDIAWVSPVAPVSAGLKTIVVNLVNAQTQKITSAKLSYTDGTNIVTQTFTGLSITAGNSQQLSFTTQYNLTESVNMRAYITTINGALDNNQINDTTFTQSLCLQLSGNYAINNTIATGGGNFMSFTDAANQLACGGIAGPVTFTVAPGSGPYMENFILPEILGASATNTITFKGSLSTLSYNATSTGERVAILLNGADHVTIDSLIIDVSAGVAGWGVAMTNQADSNRIINCQVLNTTSSSSTNYMGIVINGSITGTASSGNNGNGNLIANNYVYGGYYGIYVYGNGSPINKHNTIRGNRIVDVYAYGMYTSGNDSILISKNDVSRPARTTITSGYGVYAINLTNALIEKNRIHNMFGGNTSSSSLCYPLYISGSGESASSPNRAENNLIYNINSGTGTIYGIYGPADNNWNYYHNTIVLDNPAATSGTTYGINVYGTDVNVKNNIVYIARGGTGTKYCLYYTTSGVNSSNNNILINNSTTGTTNSIGYQGGGYATLADWKAANGMVNDQQSLGLDPVFFNPGAGNYTPTSSLVDNKGMPVGITMDILDSVRSTTNPDIGAYEFSTLTSGINVAAEALINPATSATGCYTNAETVTIRIRNASTSTLDFAVNPVTVTTNISGAVSQVLSATINSGTLSSDATLNVPMSAMLDMSIAGTYTFNANATVSGDVNSANDAMLPVNRIKEGLTAGTASGPSGYCVSQPINPTLSSMGYTGNSGLQWVASTTAVGGYSNIAGGTTVPFTVPTAPTQTMYYKLVASCGTVKDSSGVVMVSYNNPMITSTTPAARCGTGTVNLGAAGSAGATLEWYAGATGGSPLATGPSFTTPSLSADSTYFYVSANIAGGSSGASPILITEMDLGTSTDQLEIQNVSPGTVDVTGWKVAISNSYTDITSVNSSIQTLSGTMNPGETKTWTDLSSASNYWGSNILWNPAQQGWAAILDNNDNLVDVVFIDWPSASIQSASITIGSATITPTGKWSGDGVDVTTAPNGESVSRQGNMDNDNLSDFVIIPFTIGTTNPGMTVPFSGFGCSSARMAVLARTNNCPVPVTLVNFTGEKQGSINKLQWTTATEVNNAGFELERSADGRNYSKLVFVASLGDNGNSNRTLTYNYNDERPFVGNGYYRLKQVDKDGKFTYSNIVLIKGSKVKDVSITSLYPNPADREINLVISSPTSEKVTIIVTDMTGKIISQTNVQVITGDNLQKMPVGNLASGTYFIKTICASGCESKVQKFVKQ